MKKLIVEIDDKYAGVASMTFTGTECKCSKTEINLTVSAVTLDNDITAIAIDADGKETEVVTKSVIDDDTPIIPLEKLMESVRQLEDLQEERREISEGLLAGLEDNDFAHDVAAIDTALAAIKRLIDIDTFDAKDARLSAKWVCMDNVYRLHAAKCNLSAAKCNLSAAKCNLSAAKCSNCNSVICDIFHVSERLLYCPVCGARMDEKEAMQS